MSFIKPLIIFLLICSGISFPSLFNISISFPNISLPNISWEYFGNYLNQLKSATPEYITKIQKRTYEFIKKTEEDKDKYLDILSNKVQESYNKIKSGVKIGSENMKYLIETTTEAAKTLSYKSGDFIKKKIMFNNILKIVDKNFGQCSKIVNEIHNLSDNIEFNLKYFLFLIISLTENFGSVQNGMSHIIFDIINCLQEKFPNVWPEINEKLISRAYSLNVKQDITSFNLHLIIIYSKKIFLYKF